MGRRAVNGRGGVRNQQRRNAKQEDTRGTHLDKYAAQRDAQQEARDTDRKGDR